MFAVGLGGSGPAPVKNNARIWKNPERSTRKMFSTSSEGRGQYGAADRHVGETAEDFIERSLDEGHQPAGVAYPQEVNQG